MKIVLLNVKYSPNLGDGVIAECLENALRVRIPHAEIESCDLAGREEFTLRQSRLRRLAILLLSAPPALVSDLLSRVAVAGGLALTLKPYFRRRLQGADVLVIGGGQLFADANLNFPTKINAALSAARANAPKVAIYAVGVETGWSPHGARLFTRALAEANIVSVSVRDRLSEKNWRDYHGTEDFPPASIGLDPALLAASVYGAPARPSPAGPGRPKAGLCITASETLALHATRISGDAARLKTFYIELARALQKEGFDVTVFTNGAADDEELLRECFLEKSGERAANGGVTVAPRPVRPGDLVSTIARADIIIGHRLHANILAYALGVPHVGLAWNRKVDAFFELTQRQEFLLPPEHYCVASAVSKTKAAMAAGLDKNLRAAIIADAGKSIDALAASICA